MRMENKNWHKLSQPFVLRLVHRYSRLIQALGAGVAGVLAQTALFEICFQILHLTTASTAVVIGAEAGILTNFYLNNRFSFSDRVGVQSLLSRLLRFHFVVSGSVLIQWTLVFITEQFTENAYLLHAAFLGGVVIGFVWNYTLYKLIVWRHTN